eukprot:TRINITY_DN101689_c0_g1_i1.p1 TRINITY_DN101689_c0_g1~~TRINITY_DN101689_c0_g1_i1.p1  ORF type:complete len:543 (-),score=85.85 TRINITY_DN101689_c0_g1_i1:139-1767(-)
MVSPIDSQADGFIHLLAEAADESHAAQVFRMRNDRGLERLALAYASFRGDRMPRTYRMTTESHGSLDPAQTPAHYALANGDRIRFQTAAEGDKDAVASLGPVVDEQLADDVSLAPLDSLSKACEADANRAATLQEPEASAKGRRLVATPMRPSAKTKAQRKTPPKAAKEPSTKSQSAKAKAKGKPKSKAAPAAPASVVVAVSDSVRDNAATEWQDVPRGRIRSMNITMGPAKGWRVVAFLKDVEPERALAGSHAIQWRMSSPGRSRTFSHFRSARGSPNLYDAVSEGTYTQIVTSVKPALSKKIKERKRLMVEKCIRMLRKRRSAPPLASDGQCPTPPKQAPLARAGAATPVKTQRKQAQSAAGQQKLVAAFVAGTPGAGKAEARRRMPPPSGVPKKAARRQPQVDSEADTQQFLDNAAAASSSHTNWSCGCQAHLRRHPRCCRDSSIPALIHLKDHVLVGRGASSDVIMDSRRTPMMLSRCHAVLNKEADGRFALVDQGSLNGVLVNSEKVAGKRVLAHGDVVTFGIATPVPELDYSFECR